ncbi:MAG TPA: DUF4852 domain-containing protein [Alphaproteobacteria bacterium]|nr:DUF4852 domain-containing protein [Alphaproteobacteria bacterium]
MKRILIILLVLFYAAPSHAQDYTPPTWANLANTLIRFNALDITQDAVIDDYGAITECDLFKAYHGDDFKWNSVRGAMRDSIAQHIATFPTTSGYATQLQLDHYDFQNKIYRLTKKSAVQRVNDFVVYQSDGNFCGTAVKNIPHSFSAVLDTPVTFDGLPLNAQDAEALAKRMADAGNPDKIIYTRFNLRITYIDPIRHAEVKGENNGFTRPKNAAVIRLDSHLDSIDFYEDAAMTKLIYTYRPSTL